MSNEITKTDDNNANENSSSELKEIMQAAQPIFKDVSEGLVRTAEIQRESLNDQLKHNDLQHERETNARKEVDLDSNAKNHAARMPIVIAVCILAGLGGLGLLFQIPNSLALVTAVLGFLAGRANRE